MFFFNLVLIYFSCCCSRVDSFASLKALLSAVGQFAEKQTSSFLLSFLMSWTQKPAPCCCWQPSPGSVSPLCCTACKQALLFIVWAKRGRWGGTVRTQREREERERERGGGEVSIQECAWASPLVDTAQMTVRESLAEGSRGTPFTTSSPFPPSLLLSLSLSPLVCLVLSLNPSLSAALSQPVCHKKHYTTREAQ